MSFSSKQLLPPSFYLIKELHLQQIQRQMKASHLQERDNVNACQGSFFDILFAKLTQALITSRSVFWGLLQKCVFFVFTLISLFCSVTVIQCKVPVIQYDKEQMLSGPASTPAGDTAAEAQKAAFLTQLHVIQHSVYSFLNFQTLNLVLLCGHRARGHAPSELIQWNTPGQKLGIIHRLGLGLKPVSVQH